MNIENISLTRFISNSNSTNSSLNHISTSNFVLNDISSPDFLMNDISTSNFVSNDISSSDFSMNGIPIQNNNFLLKNIEYLNKFKYSIESYKHSSVSDVLSLNYSTIGQSHLSTFFLSALTYLKPEKRGRQPGKIKYDVVNYNEKLYAIITIQHKKEDIKFIIDHSDLSSIIKKPWHLSSGKYIATNYLLEDGTSKELYLHNFLKGQNTTIGDNEKEYVIHINNNLFDNRMENLRLVDSNEYYHGKTKRKRNITLPDKCGFNADDIPKYISYVKANGDHGDRFTIEIPRLQIFRKLSSSKKITLKSKLDDAIHALNEIYKEHPNIDPNKENILKNSLIESFNTILTLKPTMSNE